MALYTTHFIKKQARISMPSAELQYKALKFKEVQGSYATTKPSLVRIRGIMFCRLLRAII